MRVMVIVKANKESEAGVMPRENLLAEMGKFNQELMKAGVFLGADGLRPCSKGKRVRFSGEKRKVIDGPFSETKEVVGTGNLVMRAVEHFSREGRRARERVEETAPEENFLDVSILRTHVRRCSRAGIHSRS